MDADLYEPTLAGLRWFWPKMVRGGVVLLHDYNSGRFSGVRQAADDFEAEYGKIAFVPLSDLHGSAAFVKE
jgi:O-methyltransferase